MTTIQKMSLFVLVGIIFFIATVFYTVPEGERAIILRLGEIVKNSRTSQIDIVNPGLHFRMPFIYQVKLFDIRLRTMDVQSSRILTSEQKYLLVDYYAKWRVDNIPLYYKRTADNPAQAETLLQQKINDAIRMSFGRMTNHEVIAGERINILSLLKAKANESAKQLGIKVIDVRIKRIDLPKEVSNSVYARMSTKREQVATRYRASGEASANQIRATADAKVTITLATARAQAAKIRADGSAEAARIYADAYNKDPKFYSLYRSLEVYREVFNNNRDILLLQPNNQFFKYFNNGTTTVSKSTSKSTDEHKH